MGTLVSSGKGIMPDPATLAEIESRILYRDDDLIILDKPAGIAVHPAPGVTVSLEPWLDALTVDGIKPGLAHRLDRDTSGCLILGRHPAALKRLGALFLRGAVHKTYWGVVEGAPAETAGKITTGLSRVRRDRLWLTEVNAKGAPAETDYRVLGQGDGRSWLELHPYTGRTHQLRVHCAYLKCPIVADPFYGRPGGPGERLHLHARRISIPGVKGEQPLIVEAEPPRHMVPALQACGL